MKEGGFSNSTHRPARYKESNPSRRNSEIKRYHYPSTSFLIDHAGAITTVAVVISTLGILVLQFSRNLAVQVGVSIITSAILFGLVVWDVIIFWMIYTETIQGLS